MKLKYPPPDFSLEKDHLPPIAGIDEVGCGPWAGPVVATAVVLYPDRLPPQITAKIHDSKLLTRTQRECVFQELHDLIGVGVDMGIGQASVEEIDQLNIAKATFLAMRRALTLLPHQPTIALVDGNRRPQLSCPVRTIINGDRKSISIAAASIIAKVTRDQIMSKLDEQFPGYGWSTNAGYGTAIHQQGLERLGVTPHHRRSYAPIARLLKSNLSDDHQITEGA